MLDSLHSLEVNINTNLPAVVQEVLKQDLWTRVLEKQILNQYLHFAQVSPKEFEKEYSRLFRQALQQGQLQKIQCNPPSQSPDLLLAMRRLKTDLSAYLKEHQQVLDIEPYQKTFDAHNSQGYQQRDYRPRLLAIIKEHHQEPFGINDLLQTLHDIDKPTKTGTFLKHTLDWWNIHLKHIKRIEEHRGRARPYRVIYELR